jgi:hypothetical protein
MSCTRWGQAVMFDNRPGASGTIGAARNVYDLLGRGFTMSALGVDSEIASRWNRMAVELCIPLAVVDAPGEDARAAYDADLVLERPDQYVAWAGAAGEAGVGRILRKAAGH